MGDFNFFDLSGSTEPLESCFLMTGQDSIQLKACSSEYNIHQWAPARPWTPETIDLNPSSLISPNAWHEGYVLEGGKLFLNWVGIYRSDNLPSINEIEPSVLRHGYSRYENLKLALRYTGTLRVVEHDDEWNYHYLSVSDKDVKIRQYSLIFENGLLVKAENLSFLIKQGQSGKSSDDQNLFKNTPTPFDCEIISEKVF